MTTNENRSNGSTIAAISTARGVGAIGIVRMSGPQSRDILARLFSTQGKTDNLAENIRPRYMYYGEMHDTDGNLLDICMAAFFEAGKSYTGEDCVELYCHGGTAVLQSVLNALYGAGAVPAKAGEFTKRAFLNGKMDLFSAEAVIDLIHAETDSAAKNAVKQLQCTKKNSIYNIRHSLIELMSSFYAEVDFPDEGVEPLMPQSVRQSLQTAYDNINSLVNSFKRGNILKNGVPIAIIGKPNAGKSSLLNALCGKDRAIVTDIEGTTRDVIEEKFVWKDRAFRIFDTAGIRNSDDRIEQMSIERSVKATEEADIIIFLTDGTKKLDNEQLDILRSLENKNVIIAVNKADLPQWHGLDGYRYIKLSTKSGEGTEQLCDELFERSEELCGTAETDTIITNERQIAALNRAKEYIEPAMADFEKGLTYDILLTEVEGAVNALGEITGENASEDVVSDIFSRFCVGK